MAVRRGKVSVLTRFVLHGLAALVAMATANASSLTVVSYSMPNGGTGSFNYQDFTYLPCPASDCTTTGASLSGGTGKLTDGISPTTDWDAEGTNTQWVGWDTSEAGGTDPLVTFNFATTVDINLVTLWMDNTNGAGGVSLPASVSIGGSSFLFAPPVSGPSGYTFSGLNIVGNSVGIQFFQTPGSNSWIMVGEVSFSGSSSASTPEPATWAMIAGGFGWLLFRRRRA
jgi:hypothetical protein